VHPQGRVRSENVYWAGDGWRVGVVRRLPCKLWTKTKRSSTFEKKRVHPRPLRENPGYRYGSRRVKAILSSPFLLSPPPFPYHFFLVQLSNPILCPVSISVPALSLSFLSL